MASSGSFNTGSYTDSGITRYLIFSWSIVSQSVADNTTTISWSLKGGGTANGSWMMCGGFKVVIAGETVYGKSTDYRVKVFNGTVIASGTKVIKHADDGTASFSASAEAGIWTWAVNKSGSGTFTLDTIARASQPSLITWPDTTNDVGDFGTEISIHMNRKSSAFTHTVRYEYGDRTGTIATGVGTGTTWVIPLEFMNDIPASTSGSGRIYVDTYNGTTLVGTKYTGFTATVPASVKPSLTVTLEDTTGTDDIYGSPVKGLSKILITPKVTLAYGSPIASYSITANGVTYGTAPATTDTLNTSGSSKVTVTVKDKRGRSTTWTYNMTVLAYTAPAISKLTVKRCDANGVEDDQGDYCQVIFSAAVSGMSSKNTAVYKLRYKKSMDTTWTESTLTALNNTYTVTDRSQVFAADGNNSYDVAIVVTDRHGSVTRSTSVSTAFTLYNCHPSGTGWRFGGVAEKENTLQNDLSLNQVGNSYTFQPSAFNGEQGYLLMATITLTALNANAPIVFVVNRRGGLCPMTLYVRFASSSTTTDPDLASFTYEGDNFGAFMVKAATSTWKLYVDNVSGWSNPCVQSWYTTDNQKSRLTVVFPEELVAGTEPNVLGTYYRAVPAKMQSILDYIYPVGSIYLSYSHVNPGTLFGGTWARIKNSFLWACDEDGEIGLTGGEKTHTLTVNELPAHSHGSVYSGNASGTKTHAWLASGGSAMAYGTVSAGGGAAHNNMPPYIHVSAWRRTA
jgi:hypothetical protein